MKKAFFIMLMMVTPVILMAGNLKTAFSQIENCGTFSQKESFPFPMESLTDYLSSPVILEDSDPSTATIDKIENVLSEITGASILTPKHKSYVESFVFIEDIGNGKYDIVIYQKWNKRDDQRVVISQGICTEKQLNLIKLKLDL